MSQNQHQHYSDLEVAPNQDPRRIAQLSQAGGVPDYSQYPEAVPPSAPAEKTAADVITDPDSNGYKVHIPAENFAPEPVLPTQEYHGHHPNQYNAVPQSETGAEAADGTAGTGRRMCGMKRRTFFMVLGLALLVIVGGIAGGVAGGVTARNAAKKKGSSSDDGSSSTTNSSNVNVMSISSLSATNWTDGHNYVHRTVFFQDPWNSVLARRWDSQNQTWTTSNLTAVLANSPIPLNPQPGTSLAAAALDWPNAYRLQLYFLDPDNTVRSVFATSPIVSPDLWQNDTMSDARLKTYKGSRLAAAWQRCANCVGVWAVAYQGPNAGAINVANYTDYTSPTIMLDGNKVAGNSTLALVPQFQGVQERLGLLSQSYSSGTSGSMQMNSFNQTWNKSPNSIMSNIPLPASSQHAAVTKWGNWNQTLVMTLLEDQSLRGTWWQGGGSKTALDSITLDGSGAPSDPKFSAIAMTLDAHFYGIVDDEVHEYTVDGTDPATMHYVGQVYP